MDKLDFLSLIQEANLSPVTPKAEEPKSIHYKGMKKLTKDFLDELKKEFGYEPFNPTSEIYKLIKFKHRITSPNSIWKKLESEGLVTIVWSAGAGIKGYRIKSIQIKC
jgi:hypothetical protein